MKTNCIFQISIMLLFVMSIHAQQGINYKAIINDANGNALANTPVAVHFTILEDGVTLIFKESHSPTTDNNGIIILNIGEGTAISGDFNSINWGNNPLFLKTEIDIGDGLSDMGTTEFKTVPYALHTETANRAMIDEVDDADADPFNEIQTLSLVDHTLILSDGGSVTLASGSGQYYYADKDGDGFGYMYEPIWILDGHNPPAFFVDNSDDCNDNDYYSQDGSPEICDGFDNDCDGEIDEDWPLLGETCFSGEGDCLRHGYYVCNEADPGGPPTCSANPGVALLDDPCNYADDDCNGVVDDGYQDGNGIYNTDITCGNCYTDCQAIYDLPNAYGRCNSIGPVPVCEMVCDPGYYDLDGIPQNGCEFQLQEDAIYVSPYGDDVLGCGTIFSEGAINTCRSITYAIEQALNQGKENVLVANGLYSETVYLEDGINLIGAYDPLTWNRNPENQNTVISGTDLIDNHAVTIVANSITQPTTISGFKIYGATNYNPSGNSYAIYIKDTNGDLVIRDNEIFGGIAGDGKNGADGDKGRNGPGGGNGNDARALDFSSDTNPGGQGGLLPLGTITLRGGAGGMSEAPSDNDQAEDGSNGVSTPFLPGGSGGSGGRDIYTFDGYSHYVGSDHLWAEDGEDGLDGEAGESGQTTGDPYGFVINDHWMVSPGEDGLKGGEGSCGGGGGAAGGREDRSGSNENVLGASGGGGGSGSEGGYGGLAGAGGGGSFCIFILDSQPPVIEDNSLFLGKPGYGGNGGNGGFPGIGGSGGQGGIIPDILLSLPLGVAGNGGKGGNGGYGGGGAGGTGGSSFGIYGFNMSGTPNYESSNNFSGGAAGKGGSGGSSIDNYGLKGAEGAVENTSYQ